MMVVVVALVLVVVAAVAAILARPETADTTEPVASHPVLVRMPMAAPARVRTFAGAAGEALRNM